MTIRSLSAEKIAEMRANLAGTTMCEWELEPSTSNHGPYVRAIWGGPAATIADNEDRGFCFIAEPRSSATGVAHKP